MGLTRGWSIFTGLLLVSWIPRLAVELRAVSDLLSQRLWGVVIPIDSRARSFALPGTSNL
jgi:hypothetical protein